LKLKPYCEFAKEENKDNMITIKFNNGIMAVVFDLYCINPNCNCVDVALDFVEIDENKQFKYKLFSISLNTETWQVNGKTIANKVLNCEELIAEFMGDLNEGIKGTIRKRIEEANAYGEENPWEWFGNVDFEDGSGFGYSEIFGERDRENFSFEYQDKKYFVDDQYCINPDCRCNDVLLTFIDIVDDGETQEPNFAIRMPLDSWGYTIEFSNVDSGEMKQVIKCFREHINNDLGLLKTRYSNMKKFGKKVIDQNQNIQRVISSKVGRNKPCPCGSGKKYKKCCGS